MKIPGLRGENSEHVLRQPREIAAWRAKVGDDFRKGKTNNAVRYVRKRAYENKSASVFTIGSTEVRIHDLCNRLTIGGDVVADRVVQSGIDLDDLSKGLAVV